jgi:hypothetical protein
MFIEVVGVRGEITEVTIEPMLYYKLVTWRLPIPPLNECQDYFGFHCVFKGCCSCGACASGVSKT